MGVVVLIYTGLFAFIFTQSDKTIENLEEKLASQTFVIERESAGHPGGNSHEPEMELPPQTGNSLFPAPLDGLYEKNKEGGLLPIKKGSMTAFKAYQRAFTNEGKPLISVIVSDFGLSEIASKTVLDDLPPEISVALSPYAEHPDDWQKRARETGHEVWMTLPIESNRMTDQEPGPQIVLRRASNKYNQKKIEWALSRTTGYAGIIAYTDDTFLGINSVTQSIFRDLFARGVGFVELNPQAPPLIETIALSSRTPYARNNVFIETTSLKEIEKIAKQYGYAVAILKPYPNSVKSVKTWLDTLPQKGFSIAPVSAVADLNNP